MKIALIYRITYPLRVLLVSLFSLSAIDAKPLSSEKIRSTSRKIDTYVNAYLKDKEIQANPITRDAIFLRRTYLSVNGRIPTLDETREFLSDPAQNKREALIDELIDSSGYRSRMFNFWADLLRLQTNQEQFGLGWHSWIRDAVDSNMHYDDFVNAMLSAKGRAIDNPALGYYLRDRNMLLDNISNTAQIFLGTQIGCAQCHDDPYNDLTQKQYYEFASFIGDTTYKSDAARHMLKRMTEHTIKTQNPTLPSKALNKRQKELHKKQTKQLNRDYSDLLRFLNFNATTNEPSKKLRLPKDYQYNDGKPGDIVTPKSIFGEPLHLTDPNNHQKDFASWITSPKNPRFTKTIVNRLWAEVFGRGIVEPLDNWSDTTRVSHPELMEYLCQVMKSLDYDVQQFMRILYHTELFERIATDHEIAQSGAYDFRGPILRRMSSEELHDSLLTLKFGNRDEARNTSIENQWKNYITSINTLFKMPIEQVIALDDTSDKLKQSSDKRRQIQSTLKQARNEGNSKKVARIQKELQRYDADYEKRKAKKDHALLELLTRRHLRSKMPKTPLRAAEKPTPAVPGSFIRQFGSSDRQTTNASHTQASIPQVLSLLNGNEITSLTDKNSKLTTKFKKAATRSEKLEDLFLTIYNQMPTETERQNYEVLMTKHRDFKSLVIAMLNSKRFLFVQ